MQSRSIWPEANVGQQYRKGPDYLVHQMLTVPTTINLERSLLWDPDPGPSSPSRTYAYWLSISPERWGCARVRIPQQAFFQGQLLLVLWTSGALSDPVLIDILAQVLAIVQKTFLLLVHFTYYVFWQVSLDSVTCLMCSAWLWNFNLYLIISESNFD